MKQEFRKLLLFQGGMLLLVVALSLPNSCANTTQGPTGGKKDTIPPYLVDAKPYPGAICFPLEKAKIYFEFNEYVTIKNSSNIFLSPPLSKKIQSRVRGKGIEVWFDEPLEPGTTYNLSFTGAVADNNEGNLFPGYNYVFSTGEDIDSMVITGTVRDCETLSPVKDATVMLYKDHSDSAVFLSRPAAAGKTDEFGYFAIPYLKDTLYRLYAIIDASNNNIYDPDEDRIGFVDSLIRPVIHVSDTLPELQAYDPKDSIGLAARRSEYELTVFREKPSKQFLKNKLRKQDRYAYITFNAPFVWIDTLWVEGYRADELVTQFNPEQDSLQIWLLGSKMTPDTMRLHVHYRKTDSLGILKPENEILKLPVDGAPPRNKYAKTTVKKDLKHEDTITVFKLNAPAERIEQYGFRLEFSNPLLTARFDSIAFTYINPKQKEFVGKLTAEADSTNVCAFILRPEQKFQKGFEYKIHIPEGTFRDVNGFRSDSLDYKVSLPTDESFSSLQVEVSGVDGLYIVELMDEKMTQVHRDFRIEKDCSLLFPYLKEGKYALRIRSDRNRNGVVDTGCVLEHRQSEPVRTLKLGSNNYIDIPAGTDIVQEIDIQEMFSK